MSMFLRRLISIVVCLVWALWFGGLIAVFIAVVSLFHALDKPIAGTGAAGIFHAFEAYQLVLAGIGLLATFVWRLLPLGTPTAPRLKTALFVLLALATVATVSSRLYISPKIDQMREERITSGPEFAHAHGLSMIVYTTEAAILLLAGLILPSALACDGATPQADRQPSSI